MSDTSASIYLASKSPRRRELLAQIGVVFDVIDVNVLEQRESNEAANDYVKRLAREKAQAGAKVYADKPVLGADTIVVLGKKILEKPQSAEQGINMLMALSGQVHHVMTAVCIAYQGREQACLNTTQVRFRNIYLSEAQAYWNTGEPADKAGGYGIQGMGAIFVDSIQGSYSSVVGLPLLETSQLLKAFNVPILNTK